MITIVQRAAEKAGGVMALARGLGIKHTSLYSWKQVPAGRVVDVERLSGIPRQELRPELYAPPVAAEAPL